MSLAVTVTAPEVRSIKLPIRSAPGLGGTSVLEDVKGWILALVLGVILLLAGTAAASITASIVAYILNALNTTGIVKANYNFVDQVIGIITPIFTIIGVVLIVVAAAFIIRKILEVTQAFGT